MNASNKSGDDMGGTARAHPQKRNLKTYILESKSLAIWAGCLMIVSVLLNHIFTGNIGAIGRDSDDMLRLVQIKDYLAGQSWFHTDQYRLGLASGTNMHWSRLPDLPIILLTYVFDIFLPQDKALTWAISLWPPVSAGILISALVIAARYWADKRTEIFTLILLATFVFGFYRFAPGSIDHHNLQIGFVTLSMALALDPKMRFWRYFGSGLAIAMSIAIGGEIYIFAAIICAWAALNWAVKGCAAAKSAQGFGIGLSAGLLFAFIGTIAPSEYGLIYCDALSRITLISGVMGGVGLAVLARFWTPHKIVMRFIALAGLGIGCGAILVLQAPQCLANPLDSLPEDVLTLWLGGVSEAQSIFDPSAGRASSVPMMLGAPLVALIIMGLRLRARKIKDKLWGAHLLVIMLIIAACAMTIYQVRFYPFAYVFALVPLAAWTARVFTQGKAKAEGSVAYLGCLALSVPFVWAIPGLLLGEATEMSSQIEGTNSSANCASESVITSFNNLPKGVISANSNMAGPLLIETPHRVVSGNYHRNWKGIATQINIAVAPTEDALSLLTDNAIDYLYYCKSDGQNSRFIMHNSSGLYANIEQGVIPPYLEPVSDPQLENGDAVIFKVRSK